MRIRNISRWEFEQLLPEPSAIETAIGEQVEWWANRAGRFIGTIAKSVAEPGWRYILLERDADGRFRVCRLQRGIESLQAASRQLVDVMEILDENDEMICGQNPAVLNMNLEAETKSPSEKER